MSITIFNNEEINQNVAIDESSILSMSWINDELDLELLIDWNGQYDYQYRNKKIRTTLVFKWITDLNINLNWRNQLQAPVITTFSFEKKNKVFKIKFDLDFNATGSICFFCNSFYFEIQTISTP